MMRWLVACLAVSGCVVGGVADAAARTGQVVLFAGTGEKGYSGDGQRAVDARIDDSGTIDVGPDGTLYLADRKARRIRAITADGVINTVPGTRALRSPKNDGPMVNGWQHSPSDRPQAVAAGRDGSLYIAGSDTVWRLGRDGSSTKIADIDVSFGFADDIAVDAGGTVFLSAGAKINRIDPAGKIIPIGGGGTLDPIDADGKPATEANLAEYGGPTFAIDAGGAIYFVARASTKRNRSSVHKINPDGTLRTVAGGEKPGFSGDRGPAAKAQLSQSLGGIAVAADGAVYVHDAGNRLVRVIGTDGVINSITPPVPSQGNNVSDLAVGPRGEVYLKLDARVYTLVRDAAKPAAKPGIEPTYPARFPNDAPGTVHTIAGNGRKDRPERTSTTTLPGTNKRLRIAEGPGGVAYYSDAARHRVVKVAADGTSSVFAGTGARGFEGDRAEATRAKLDTPTGVAVGQDGSVFIADSGNYRVRKVGTDGVITTVAGDGTKGDRNGTPTGAPATQASVTPLDVAVGPDGSLVVAEDDNSRISRLTPDGKITAFAGAGKRWMQEADGHPAAEADFYRPMAVAVSRSGAVYLLDGGWRDVRPSVRMIDPNGIVRTVAGDAYRDENEAGYGGDGGPGGKAELNNPHDIAAGPDGTLYIADTYNARVRAVDAAGTITTIAGTGQPADTGDGAAATAAAVNEPQTLDVDATGAIHTIPLAGNRIRRINQGTITTVATITAQEEAPKPATETFLEARGMAIDHDGRLLVADQATGLFPIEPNGTLGKPQSVVDEVGVSAVAIGLDGTRYVATADRVHRVSPDGVPVLVAGGGPAPESGYRANPGEPATMATFGFVHDLAVSPAGRLYIATGKGVYRVDEDGTLAISFAREENRNIGAGIGITVDAKNRLYLADSEGNRVYRVEEGGNRTTVAEVSHPTDVAADNTGNIYIAGHGVIRRVDPEGTMTTVVEVPKTDDLRYAIDSLVLDRHGDLYYFDSSTNQVKVLVQPGKLTEPFDWWPVVLISAGVLMLGVAGWFGFRWWRRRPQPSTVDTEVA